jgi:uncharacterized protein (TIGR03435 family)
MGKAATINLRFIRVLLSAGIRTAIVLIAVPGQGQAASDQLDWEKAAGGHQEFEVAAIHQGKPGEFQPPLIPLGPDDTYSDTHGRFFADFPLTAYIDFAYKQLLTEEQRSAMLSSVPKWVASEDFVIEAKAAGNPTKDQMRLMVRSLLQDRFKLAAHFENRVSPVLFLLLDKPRVTGPNLRPHSQGPPCDQKTSPADREEDNKGPFPPICDAIMLRPVSDGRKMQLGSRNTTMDLLAESLTTVGDLGRPVVNQTDLTGRYDFTLTWNPEPNPAQPDAQVQSEPSRTTFLEALHDQLGLKLKTGRAPVRTIIIDHIEPPTPN